MANVRLRWTLPTTRSQGGPLPVSEIQSVEIAVSADGGTTFQVSDVFMPSVLETLFTEVDFGLWTYRCVVIDSLGQRSVERFATADVKDTSPPGAVVTFEAVIE